MSRSVTLLPRGLRGVCVSLLVASLLTPSPADAAVVRPNPCDEVTFSPDFAKDGTGFCAGVTIDSSSGVTTGIPVFVTRDRGHSWEQSTAAGLAFTTNDRLRGLAVSPRYSVDREMYVQLYSGIYRSNDLGATFTLADPLDGGAELTPFVSSLTGLGGVELGARTLLAAASSGAGEGANRSALVDPALLIRQPVTGTPGFDRKFVVSPDFATDGLAYGFGEFGAGSTARVEMHGCTATFICSSKLAAFPVKSMFDRAWLAADFSSSKTMYVSLRGLDQRYKVWWSRDGGHTFASWKPVQSMLDEVYRIGGDVQFGLTAGRPGSRTLWLRVISSLDRPNPPGERLLRSDDNGATWKLIAFGRYRSQLGPRGTMPRAAIPPTLGNTPAGGVLRATADGRLFLLGLYVQANQGFRTVYCSSNGGRTWATFCP